MKKILLFLAVTLTASTAWATANFSGHWITTNGKLSSTVGLKADCNLIEIEIEQTPSTILTKSYKAKCGTYDSHWGPVEQQILEGKVFEGEDEVGTISEDTLISVSHDGGVAYAYNLKLTKNPDGSPNLQTYYGVKNGVGAIVIEGNLLRK